MKKKRKNLKKDFCRKIQRLYIVMKKKKAPCNLIFYTANCPTWEEEILKHYPEGKQWERRSKEYFKQLKTKAGTINVYYTTGTIMVQDNSETLKIFPNDFPALRERVRKSVKKTERVEESEPVEEKMAALDIGEKEEERGEQRRRESEDIKEEDIKGEIKEEVGGGKG